MSSSMLYTPPSLSNSITSQTEGEFKPFPVAIPANDQLGWNKSFLKPQVISMQASSFSRRDFLVTSAGVVLGSNVLRQVMADSGQGSKPLLKPKHDEVICPWTPRHPRHDHQLIFPLTDEELMLVWCEYYVEGEPTVTKKEEGYWG
ncbi:MAG: hypothetical protein R3C11_02020 [Planctomycetaceae bacterium]